MAVFVSNSDETEGAGIFHHAGYVAPETDWDQYFVPAWQEWVLDSDPAIEHLHLSDMRRSEWQHKHGISDTQVQRKIDEAIRIIGQMGSLIPICSTVDAVHFGVHAQDLQMRLSPERKPADFVKDHICYMGYVFVVLNWVHTYRPEAERVDFVIEKKREVFPAIHAFHESLRESFPAMGVPHLATLLGQLIPGDKERIPLQAADVLCWHSQRMDAGACSDVDLRRFGSLSRRSGMRHVWPKEDIETMCKSFREALANGQVEGV